MMETRTEGVVSYRIFQKQQGRLNGRVGATTEADNVAAKARLLAQCAAWEDAAQEFVGSYVWNNEGFRLNVANPGTDLSRAAADGGCSAIFGCTNFGDCYQDEWLVVRLLLELSRREPDVVVQVWDDDGNFLFIEGADHLPAWVTPENSSNCCFLKNGRFHLLTPSSDVSEFGGRGSVTGAWDGEEGEGSAGLSLAAALTRLHAAQPPDQFVASSAFHQQIKSRIREFDVRFVSSRPHHKPVHTHAHAHSHIHSKCRNSKCRFMYVHVHARGWLRVFLLTDSLRCVCRRLRKSSG